MKTKFLFCLFADSGLGEATILTADSINCGWDNHISEGSNSIILGDQNSVMLAQPQGDISMGVYQ